MFVTEAKGNDEVQVVEATFFDFLPLVLVAVAIPLGFWFIKAGHGSLPRKGYLDTAITPTMTILLCLGMVVLGGFGGMWGQSQVASASTSNAYDSIEQSAWMYASAMVAQLPIVLIYALLRRKCYSKHIVSVTTITFLVFVPLTLGIAGVAHLILSSLGLEEKTELGHATLVQLSNEPWSGFTLVIILSVTLGAGIIEEVMYRGLIFPLISTMFSGRNLWKPVIVTSVLFMGMHYGASQPSAMVGLFVFSIGLCWARVKSGGILAPVLIHVLFNAMNIAFVYSTEL